jgi:DNA-binding Lrp family transcriptional regulator
MEKRNIKNLRIIRILLDNPDGSLTKYKISKKAECSAPWVIEFLRNLEEKKIVKGTKVLDIDRLVDFYIQTMSKLKYIDFFVKNPIDFLKRIRLNYALTTYAAENYFTRQLFLTRYDIYVQEKDFKEWKSIIMKKGLIGKGNFRLIIAYDKKIFDESAKIKGMNIVSVPLLLIDLKHEGGVCMESYSLLKQNVRKH